jgi:multicomponent Na+:H+ antiporter subunit G
MIEFISGALLVAGAFFYFAGTVGLLRFPDLYTRLHALAKADNLGLGCVVAGLALQAESIAVALKVSLIWPLALVASAAISYIIAHRADALGIAPWRGDVPPAAAEPAGAAGKRREA